MNANEIYMFVGFVLAAYSIVANDAIQTLGTFLSANAERPWWVLWAYACSILLFVFFYGWAVNFGDVTYGRLAQFPEPETGFTWLHIVPPLFVLLLTRYGVPVSTTFLILTVFTPGNLGAILSKSILGYVLAIGLALIVYMLVAKTFESKFLRTRDQPVAKFWYVLQWATTGFLWSQWLIQDLANIFIYMPRHLTMELLVLAVVILLCLHAILFYFRGGAIQGIVNSKTNTEDVRSATFINLLFGGILLFFKEYSSMPMSTTWVFLGLLAGREIAMTLHIKHRELKDTGKMVFRDAAKASFGLATSVIVALTLPMAYNAINGAPADAAQQQERKIIESTALPAARKHGPEHLKTAAEKHIRTIAASTHSAARHGKTRN